MDSNNSKISFIPKESLVREESFLERRRPRSAMIFIASFIFISSVVAYAGLLYYNNSLNQTIANRITEIENLQKEFTNAPEVREARVFIARANLARELLSSHIVVSPIFEFLSNNTVGTILYDKFSFDNGEEGATVDLSGEAPNYASLAYQADVFKKQTKALSSFTVNEVTLTEFGTVSFSFTIIFKPDFLSYLKNSVSIDYEATPKVDVHISTLPTADTASLLINNIPAPTVPTVNVDTASMSVPTDIPTGIQQPNVPEDSVAILNSVPATGTPTTLAEGTQKDTPEVAKKQSFLSTLWERFKFW
ncbi:MAG: hypothetical protein WBC83_01475 [Minisyncoccia bacterium]